jgi:ribosomal protein S27AE
MRAGVLTLPHLLRDYYSIKERKAIKAQETCSRCLLGD